MESVLSLGEFIEALLTETKVHVCLHDISGITGYRHFEIQVGQRIHCGSLCNLAKQTPRGLELCLHCKEYCNRKALRGIPFRGHCPIGLAELVHPIVLENQIRAILYIGNLLDDETLFETRIRRTCRFTGAAAQPFLDARDSAWPCRDLQEYEKIGKAIQSYMQLLLNNYGKIPGKESNWIVDSFISYVQSYYAGEITLEKLAKSYSLNAKYAGRLFRRYTGMHFCDYVNQVRIRHAARMLTEETDKTILEIALDCGFGNISYFNRIFRRLNGMTPKEYRKRGTAVSLHNPNHQGN